MTLSYSQNSTRKSAPASSFISTNIFYILWNYYLWKISFYHLIGLYYMDPSLDYMDMHKVFQFSMSRREVPNDNLVILIQMAYTFTCFFETLVRIVETVKKSDHDEVLYIIDELPLWSSWCFCHNGCHMRRAAVIYQKSIKTNEILAKDIEIWYEICSGFA